MKNMQGKIPIILSIALAVTMIALSAGKLKGWDGKMRSYGFLMVGLYLLWLLAEASVAIGEINRERTCSDQGTCEWYALGRAATIITALTLPTRWTASGPWIPVGIGLFLSGIGVRLWAIRCLGPSYSHRIRPVESHRIIVSGPYRVIRHPAYSGMLLSHTGFVIFFFNWISIASLLGVFLPAILRRITVEERILLTTSNQSYRDYSQGRKKLIPFVW
jgi:protein-S-isoprenylcysteine O-methyltransferase Ste14